MADILAEHPEWRTMARGEVAIYLNGRGHQPARSTLQKPTSWTKGSIRRPLDEARTLLHARIQGVPAKSINHLASLAASPVDSPSRAQFPVYKCAEDEIVVADAAPDVLGLAEATKMVPSKHTGVTQTLASYGPPRGAAEAPADTGSSELTAVLGLGRSTANQGSASSAFPDQPDIAGVSVDKIDPGVAVEDAELTAAGKDAFDVRNNPLWGRF